MALLILGLILWSVPIISVAQPGPTRRIGKKGKASSLVGHRWLALGVVIIGYRGASLIPSGRLRPFLTHSLTTCDWCWLLGLRSSAAKGPRHGPRPKSPPPAADGPSNWASRTCLVNGDVASIGCLLYGWLGRRVRDPDQPRRTNWTPPAHAGKAPISALWFDYAWLMLVVVTRSHPAWRLSLIPEY